MKTKKFMLTAVSLLTLLGYGGKAPAKQIAGSFAPVNQVKMASTTSYPIYDKSSSNCTAITDSIVTVSGQGNHYANWDTSSESYVEADPDHETTYYLYNPLGSSFNSISATDHDYVNITLYSSEYNVTNISIYNSNHELLPSSTGYSSYYLGDNFPSTKNSAYVVSFPTSYLSLSGGIYFYTADTFPESATYVTAYLVDAKSVIKDGETAEIAVNVDDAPTIDEILAQVTSQDLIGGAVAVSCTDTEKAKYNPNQLGTYTVTITATDTYGQTATAYLKISVIDITAPTVTLASGKNLNFYVKDTLSYSSIASYFTITDNATSKGGTINTASYTLDGNSFTADYTFTAVGTHSLGVSVSDSSGNIANKTFTITVTDNEAPVISRRDGGTGSITVGLSRVLNLAESDFLALFQAIDGVDGDVSANLAISGDFIPSKVGTYEISITASDKSGNTGYLTASVVVDADMPPVFILSDTLINATTSNPLTSSQIQQVIALAFYSDTGVTAADVLINDTEYQENSEKAGNYTVSYSVSYTTADGELVNDTNKKLTISVTDTGTVEESELSWWETFWQCFKNWFRGVFTKFKFNCWITDADWELRFPNE